MEDERTLKHIAMMHINTAGKAFMDTDDTVNLNFKGPKDLCICIRSDL